MDTCSVMAKVAETVKRMETVPESPEPSPSKLPACVKSVSKTQTESLNNITINTDDCSLGLVVPSIASFGAKKPRTLFSCSRNEKAPNN